MRLRLPVSLVLLFAVSFLTPLASASAPDPSWIPGIYDGGDFDEVVVALMSAVTIFEAALFPLARPTDVWMGASALAGTEDIPAVVLSTVRPRAPPP